MANAAAQKTTIDVPARLEELHSLLDSAIRDGEKEDIAHYSALIESTNGAISAEDAPVRKEALSALFGVLYDIDKPRSGTTIIDESGLFNKIWRSRAVEITRGLFENGGDMEGLRMRTAIRLITEDRNFAQAVVQQAALDTQKAAEPDTGQQR